MPPVTPQAHDPRDADRDGVIYEGTPHERPVARGPSVALPAPAAQPRLRDFGDAAAAREAIYAEALAAAQAIPPAVNRQHELSLVDVAYEGPADFSLADQKRAVLEGLSLGRRLRGTYILKDVGTGHELGRKRTTVAVVPYLSPRGTIVHNGTEYSLASQLRLRPGVFSRRQVSGELESHINVLPGQGLSHRVYLEPESGVFRIKIGQAKMPLLPLLRAMGATDPELQEAWGRDLLYDNSLVRDSGVLDKLHRRLARDPDATPAGGRATAVAAEFAKMRLDPDVSRRTLGTPHDAVTKGLLLDVTRKLVALNRGEAEPDDRDHLAYMTLHGPEDLVAERIANGRHALRQVLWKVSRTADVNRVPAGLLTRAADAAILSSGLAEATEAVNPIMVYGQQGRVSRLGEGGIPSVDSVPEESRNVQPSSYGFVDYVWTPESLKVGVDSRVARNARKGDDGRIYAKFRDVRSGAESWLSPDQVADKAVAFPGELASGRPTVSAIQAGRLRTVPREKVDYELPHAEDGFSAVTNLVPMKSAVKPQRAVMAGRMISQALPIVDPEAPLVQSGIPGEPGRSFEDAHGEHAGAVRSKIDGTVSRVDAAAGLLELRGRDGRAHRIELYRHFPSNRKTGISQTPVVRPGDPVQPGVLLARSNYTDAAGTVALGKNARVAFVPDGHNFEDAISVSRSFADRMTSDHYYQHHLQRDEAVKVGKHAYAALFPGRYDRKTLDAFDDDGVIRPGTTVLSGQPLVLAARRRDRTYGAIHRGRQAAYADAAETWEHHRPGVVTDVARTKKGILVVVRTQAPLEVGDKLCYDPTTEVLTRDGWKSIATVTVDDAVASLGAGNRIEYLNPVAAQRFDHKGPMYSLETTQASLLVTPEHELYAQVREGKDGYRGNYRLIAARDISGRRYRLKRNAAWSAPPAADIILPAIEVAAGQFGRGTRTMPEVRVPARVYAMVLGMFLPDGNTFNGGPAGGGFEITKFEQPNRQQMLDALRAAGFAVGDCKHGGKIRIHGKQWYEHLRQFGHAPDKFIPEFVFDWDAETAAVLYDWMMRGGGHRGPTHHSYCTVSPRLADGVQRLVLHLGMSANIDIDPPSRGVIKGKEYDFRARYRVSIFRTKNEPEVNHGHSKRQAGQREAWVDYDGPVHCVTLPRNHVLYVRRHGKPIWCGNSGRHGNKGVVSKIHDDADMPHDKDGRPYEVLLNPLGLVSRGNPAQMVEAALGKVAAKTGRPYKVADFGDIPNLTEYAQGELAKHGLADTEETIDPRTGRRIRDPSTGQDPFTGNMYIMKLHHTAESKGQGRGLGAYTSEGIPARGGAGGSKRVSLMDVNALLSHGATAVIRDAGIRGQAQPEYWQQVMSGHAPPAPRVPLVYEKLFDQLRAAGINPVRTGTRTQLMALTDRDVDALAGGRVLQNAETVDWKRDLRPVKGGLFDGALTGGAEGNSWAAIALHEPMPSPAMEEPIRRILGLTEAGFRDVLAGRAPLGDRGTGPAALKSALAAIDLDRAIEKTRRDFENGRKTARSEAARRLGYLTSAKRLGLHPGDWVLSRVPVLPPRFRPVSLMRGSGLPMVADSNLLYRELWDANENLKALSGQVTDVGAEREALYDAFKGVVGLGDPLTTKNRERQVTGIFRHIIGPSPKHSVVQRKLISTATDLVGRAVITPDPDLDIDHVGVPEDKAWEVFRPFVVRELVRQGVPKLRAAHEVEGRTPLARRALLKETETRPIILNRAPTLHRYSFMGAWARLVPGDTLRLPPLVYKGYGADNDGDAMSYHVPSSDDAVRDVIDKMLPSRNLLSVSEFRAHQVPSQELVSGMYTASVARNAAKRPRTFATARDAARAWRRGELAVDDPVEIVQD